MAKIKKLSMMTCIETIFQFWCLEVYNIYKGRIGIVYKEDYWEKDLKSRGEQSFPTFGKPISTLDLNFWIAFSLTTRQSYN